MDGSSSNPYLISSSSSSTRSSSSISTMESSTLSLPKPSPIPPTTFQEFRSSQSKREILKGTRISLKYTQGTRVFDMLNYQNLLKFTKQNFKVYEELVEWFYKFVTITCDPNEVEGKKVVFEVMYPPPHTSLVYNEKNLFDDFGLVFDGRIFERSSDWVDELGLEIVEEFGDVYQSDIPSLNDRLWHDSMQMSGDDLILGTLLETSILPISSDEYFNCSALFENLLSSFKGRRLVNWPCLIAQHMMECLYTPMGKHLPYGGLISHIVMKWKVFSYGTELPRPTTLDSVYLADVEIYKVKTKFLRLQDSEEKHERWINKEMKKVAKLRKAQRASRNEDTSE